MRRRDFFKKTGSGISGMIAVNLGLVSFKKGNNVSIDAKSNSSKEFSLPANPSDFDILRQDYPPLQRYSAYLDTAFIGLMSRQVKAAHHAFLEERMQFGPFAFEKSILGIWMDKMEEVRVKLASFLGAHAKEIAFTYCTGCGSNIALNGIDWQKGDNAVIDDLEYPTDFHVLNALRKKGVELRIARNENGAVSPEKFAALTNKRTRAFVVSHVSYLNGFRHDLKILADIIHNYGGYLVVDSAQSVGGVHVNVKEENVDFLSGIPYKWLNGPNGVGFFYVREGLISSISPDRLGWASTDDFKSLETMESKDLPDHAKRFEYGTLGFEGIYALDMALDYINQIGIEAIEQRNLMLINRLREKLRAKGVKFYTPENNNSPILTFFMENEREFGRKMKERGFYITARRWGQKGHVRLSPHFYNNEEDIDAFMQAFSSIVK